MSWIELQLLIDDKMLEDISGYLFAMGCEGMNVTEDSVVVYFSQSKWSDEIRSAIIEYIRHFEPTFTERNFKIKSMAEQDWNQIWKESFRKIRLTNRISIKPPWDNYKGVSGEIVVTIDPKMAFGTGHHESTQLIIESLEKLIKQDMSVFDVGTGSGILSIISENLGAEKIVAIDNDEIAIKNAREGLLLNKCKRVRLFVASLEYIDYEEFDLVLANINRNVLLHYASSFPLFMKLNAKLALSGILLSDEGLVTKTYQQNGFKVVSKSAKRDWLSLVFELIKKEENPVGR